MSHQFLYGHFNYDHLYVTQYSRTLRQNHKIMLQEGTSSIRVDLDFSKIHRFGSVRFGSVRKISFLGSTRFGLRFSDVQWLGTVRFGSFPRPVPAGSRIERFGSVRPRFGSYSFLMLRYGYAMAVAVVVLLVWMVQQTACHIIYIYIYVHTHVCVYMYIYIYIYICLFIYLFIQL